MPSSKRGPFMSPWHHLRRSAALHPAQGRSAQVRAWTRFAFLKQFWLYVFPGIFLWVLAFHWFGFIASLDAFFNGLWRGPANPPLSFALLGTVVAAAYDAWALKVGVLDKGLAGKLESVFSRLLEIFWRAVPVVFCAVLVWGSDFCAVRACGDISLALAVSVGLLAFFLGLQFFCDLVLRGLFALGCSPKPRLTRLDFGKARPGFLPKLTVAHLADLHLTKDSSILAVSGQPGGNLAFEQLMREQRQPLEDADLVFICGDVADAGRSSEWEVFFRGYPESLLHKSILVPGNHDVNIIDPADRLAQDPDLVLRRKRLIRTMAALDLVQGERAWILDERFHRVRLRDYLADFADDFKAYIEHPPVPVYDKGALAWIKALLGLKRFDIHALEEEEHVALPGRVWDAIFPMAVELPGGKAVALVLDSNTASSSLLDNALGQISPDDLHRLRHFQEHYKDWAQVILLHHHVALPRLNFGFWGNLQSDLMTLLNADALLNTVSDKKGLIFFHGHKHLDYMAESDGEFQVFSAPSSTLGDELDPKRGKGYFTMKLSFSKDGRAAVVEEPKFWGI